MQIHPQVRWRCDVAGIKTRDHDVHEPVADLVTLFLRSQGDIPGEPGPLGLAAPILIIERAEVSLVGGAVLFGGGCEQVMSGVPRVVRFNVQCIFNRPEVELLSRPVSIA